MNSVAASPDNGPRPTTVAPLETTSEDDEDDEEFIIDAKEMVYAVESFYTIVQPVFLTMVFSALAVIFISTPQFSQATEEQLSQSYKLIKTSDDDGNATKLGLSVINGLVIVAVICFMTFIIVLFYKFKCFKCLSGYMVFSSTMILALLASNLSSVAVDRYNIPIDKISFYLIMFNFAIPGVIAIIAPQGVVPAYITQFYLAATSIVVAWHFARFDPWTAWVLLIILALYDLFAVLSPWGPLRALVNLMHRDDSPMIPGLLYEASLPFSQQQRQQHQHRSQPTFQPPPQTQNDQASSDGSSESPAENSPLLMTNDEAPPIQHTASSSSAAFIQDNGDHDNDDSPAIALDSSLQPTTDVVVSTNNMLPARDAETPPMNMGVPGRIPLALAVRYKLRFEQDPQPYWIADPDNIVTFTPAELQQEVNVLFPHRGGRVVPTVSLNTPTAAFYRRTHGREDTRYTIIDYNGNHLRVIFVNNEGRVFEDLREQQHDEDSKERTSIKLGLGDFIFYSILVSKAALYSFTASAACLIAIVSGLGLTLLLLAVHGKALPALPISIFGGVLIYLTTRFCMEPWLHDIFEAAVFV